MGLSRGEWRVGGVIVGVAGVLVSVCCGLLLGFVVAMHGMNNAGAGPGDSEAIRAVEAEHQMRVAGTRAGIGIGLTLVVIGVLVTSGLGGREVG